MPYPHATDPWQAYVDNLPRHAARIARDAEQRVMAYLTGRGYSRLAMNFAQPLSTLSFSEMRPSDLAARMGISKQLCAQALRPILEEGYISKRDDPNDRRARILTLTERGRALVSDAMHELKRMNGEYDRGIGRAANGELGALMVRAIGADPGAGNTWTTMNAGFFARSINQKLLQVLAAKGHNALQPSYNQVLLNIDLDGTSVAHLARYNRLTGQAISRIARELEQLRYIHRRTSLRDGRSRVLLLAARGRQFVQDYVEAWALIGRELEQRLTPSALTRLSEHAAALATALDPDSPLRDHEPGSMPALTTDDRSAVHIDHEELLLYFASLLDRHAQRRLTTPLRAQPDAPLKASEGLQRRLRQQLIETERVRAAIRHRIGANAVAKLEELIESAAVYTR